MKSNKTLRTIIAVLSVLALIVSASGFWRTESERQSAVLAAEDLMGDARHAEARAERLGEQNRIYESGAQPVRTDNENGVFSDDLVRWVDSENAENRLWSEIGSLAARSGVTGGATYAAVSRAAARLRVAGAPGVRSQRAKQRGGVERARTDLGIVGLHNGAALLGPVVLERQDHLLERQWLVDHEPFFSSGCG
jgi:hypothetical protein